MRTQRGKHRVAVHALKPPNPLKTRITWQYDTGNPARHRLCLQRDHMERVDIAEVPGFGREAQHTSSTHHDHTSSRHRVTPGNQYVMQ